LKNSNLCDHNSPTSQTDGRTDGQTDRQTTCDRNTALCTKVHRAVKTVGEDYAIFTVRTSSSCGISFIQKFWRIPLNGGGKQGWGWKRAIFYSFMRRYLEKGTRLRYSPQSLLMINRKLYTLSIGIKPYIKLDDLEQSMTDHERPRTARNFA